MPDKLELPPEIEKYYEKWKREPQSRVFAQLADAYRKSGMLDEAIGVCLEGLKLHPSYGSARMVLARTYQDKGMDAEAELELWEVIGNDPDNILANRMLGDLLHKGGKTLGAFEQYKRVLKLTPLDREIKAILENMETILNSSPAPAMAEAKKGTAEEEYIEPAPLGVEGREESPPPEVPAGTSVDESKAEDAFLTETLADLYLKQGLKERAAEIFSRMLASDPNNSHLQERLLEAMGLQGEIEGGGGGLTPSLQTMEEPRENVSSSTGEEDREKEVVLDLSVLDSIEELQPTQAEGIRAIEPEEHIPASLDRKGTRPEILQRWLRAAQQRRQRFED